MEGCVWCVIMFRWVAHEGQYPKLSVVLILLLIGVVDAAHV